MKEGPQPVYAMPADEAAVEKKSKSKYFGDAKALVVMCCLSVSKLILNMADRAPPTHAKH